jgi:stage II sporulation protein AA (anti-sigma F factor antagonist)
MSVATRRSGDTAILEPDGRLAGGAVDEFRSKWTEAVGDANVHMIVVNLGHVTMVDSTGIGTMIRCHSAITRNGGRMKIVGANPTVREAFKITRLDSVFEFHDTEQSALR